MGKIYPDFVGAFTNSLGETVYYMWNGQNWVSRKGVQRKVPTFLQKRLRAQFSMLVQLAFLLQEAIRIGFLRDKRGVSRANLFSGRIRILCGVIFRSELSKECL